MVMFRITPFLHILNQVIYPLLTSLFLALDYQITDRLSAILAYRRFNTASFNGYNPDVVHLIEMAIRMES